MRIQRWWAAACIGLLGLLACGGGGGEEGAQALAPQGEFCMDQHDRNLPPEPVIPSVCPDGTIYATHAVRASGDPKTDGLPIYDPAVLDTAAIQARIDACAAGLTAGAKGSVRLRVDSRDRSRVAFVSGPLYLRAGVTLWIDKGVTLFAAQDPRLYDKNPGSCGTDANDTSSGCNSLINANGAAADALLADAGVMGEGAIDGLGGEPMVGGFNGNPSATWWDVAQHAKPSGASHSNPRLVDVTLAKRFTLYKVTLRNSPKFHVGLESDDYLVWGVTIQTPSRTVNSVGRKLTPAYARNTDGIDPSDSWNGVIAYSRISTGDDQIAIKCGKYHLNSPANAGQPSCRNLTVAHVAFGTGHGMSIGSETNGGPKDDSSPRIGMQGLRDAKSQRLTQLGLHVYDLTIDGTSGTGGTPPESVNGIRIKSDVSRGGLVSDVLYEDVCMRNLYNPIVLNPHYDQSKVGTLYPSFQNVVFRDIHQVKTPRWSWPWRWNDGSAPIATPAVTLLGLDDAHRTSVTLDNVSIDGIDRRTGVIGQYADVILGPGPVNFVPFDSVSPAGSPSTVTVSHPRVWPPRMEPPESCAGRFLVNFPDFGTEVSPDNNASLAALALTADGAAAGLNPAFASGVTRYAVTIPYATRSLTLAPTASAFVVKRISVVQDGGASADVGSGSPVGLALPAPGGSSSVVVTVTAEDGTTSKAYEVLVSRVAPATDSSLASLSDSAGSLTFDPDATSTEYVYGVPEKLSGGYTLTAAPRDPHATLFVDGAPVASGMPSAPIDLSSRAATVTVSVVAEDGVTTTVYTLRISVTQEVFPVTGIALSASFLRLDGLSNPSAALVATLSPSNATDRDVTFASSAPGVATVDASGVVRAVSAGKAIVTATSHDGGFTASCTVYVFTPALADGFEGGSGMWDLLPVSGPNGAFSIATDGSSVLKYTAGTVGGVLALVKSAAWNVAGGDYYVEARIKPQSNSTTGNKQLYLIARYQDPSNWYAAGLNVQSSTTSTQVEIAKMASGTLSRPGQVKKPISMDSWYTVRFELKGSALSVFLDGELVKTVTDTAFTSGRIGLFTANKSFEIDDVRVGDPSDRPLQFTISPSTDWTAEVGDAPRVVTVAAQRPDYDAGGYVADGFTVSSSDPSVVSATVAGNAVALQPLKAGTAIVTFASATNPSLTRTITAVISPAYVQSTTVYALAGKTTPAAGDSAAYPDGRLAITFDSPVTLGTTSSVRIFRRSDDVLVDVIKPGPETDALGYPGQDQLRVVNVELLGVSGNTLSITPHHAKLAWGTEYYVVIGSGVVSGTVLSGKPFDGLGKAAAWTFTTRAAPATSLTSVVVDDDGAADFRTVQGALDFLMKNAAKDTPVRVDVRNGVYPELLFLRAKNAVTIAGESRDGVVIQYRNSESQNSGSGASQASATGTPAGGRSVLLVEGADLLTLDTLTLRNTTLRSASASQAEVLYFNNDTGRLVARNATFLSEQDTLQLKGYTWFSGSLVAGNVDFIWGSARAALFEGCEIRSVGDTNSATSGGYIVQARAASASDKGFVFLNSRLTHGAGPGPLGGDVPAGATYLARSAGSATAYDNVAFIGCQMDKHVSAAGWAYGLNGQPIPNPSAASAASGWREWGTTDLSGTPLDPSAHVGGYKLTDAEAAAGFATRAQIFAAFNGGAGWNPQ